ncbi:CcoQ/FixQ family Cbb3-type cytochrome c oxidase assembly chaperone [Frigidibacter mobilis]|uniref:Cbb3-type cytochrome c oxidase subunit IV n=1 Tax=Frigidibacter mobilis TaxID=1335048 RepID=A0A159Z8U2_9RHOB|nr:CcoQ/FixQ family Cbb3-type cytochrome c oxidase assembly chaperone [Frigidibacter mobilis]AMY71962.1 cbb3-type cytochrome c oxidase subunit IV [Frigidibacter mobilis]
MDYHILREFADSWALLALTLFFVGVVIWAFRPGSSKIYKDTANIPFRNEDRPACAGTCADCGSDGTDTGNGAAFKEAWK